LARRTVHVKNANNAIKLATPEAFSATVASTVVPSRNSTAGSQGSSVMP
jgi:hypothetical protein